MARIGHASISEKSTINGTKGDGTGREVCIREFYSKPWDFAAIHPNATVREKHAKAIEAACKNDNIGYGQSDRNTLNTLAKAVGYDLSRVGKCNCDCSSLQNVAAVASGSGATYGSNGWTTSTMKSALKALGYKIVTDTTMLASAAYCVRGAIYVKASSHTVAALDNGTKYADMLKKAGITTTETTAPVSDTGSSSSSQTSGSTDDSLKVGDVVTFSGSKHYTSAAGSTGSTCKPGKAKITAIAKGKAHPYHLIAVSGGGSTVYGWVDASTVSVGSEAAAATSYRVKITADVLNIRKGPGTNYGTNGSIKGGGIYTIVAESTGTGATKWGKLKSGAGWISLDYASKV